MARATTRRRRPVATENVRVLKALGFRYSVSRDAYVLRIFGNRVGPVFQIRQSPPETSTLITDASRDT